MGCVVGGTRKDVLSTFVSDCVLKDCLGGRSGLNFFVRCTSPSCCIYRYNIVCKRLYLEVLPPFVDT